DTAHRESVHRERVLRRRKRCPPPTSTAWRWSSRGDAISATDSRDTWLPPSGGSSPWLPPSGGRSSWRGASHLVLLLLACAVYFVALGNAAIWDANEAFYVETPREMLEGNDFVNPSFNYLPRFNKPVLSYWIVAFLYRLFGVSVGVQRFGIALGALIIIVCAYVLAHRGPRTEDRGSAPV